MMKFGDKSDLNWRKEVVHKHIYLYTYTYIYVDIAVYIYLTTRQKY